ncbi:hypothetical protein RAMDARK_1780 [Rickettsia amblyommatis str. Darkwater]|nr:hypothetical protein RAMDARK_1780 [Rickettsia amblyommatis str. Darkwater]
MTVKYLGNLVVTKYAVPPDMIAENNTTRHIFFRKLKLLHSIT